MGSISQDQDTGTVKQYPGQCQAQFLPAVFGRDFRLSQKFEAGGLSAAGDSMQGRAGQVVDLQSYGPSHGNGDPGVVGFTTLATALPGAVIVPGSVLKTCAGGLAPADCDARCVGQLTG
jgi:hypothetical protein